MAKFDWKSYRDKNKEKFKEYHKIYYIKNRELLRKKAKIADHSERGKLYRVVRRVNQRCNNPKSDSYKYYGGRGIKSFLSLKDVEFLWIRDGGSKMKRPSIDRINPDLHYSRDNCRFIELRENSKRALRGNWLETISPSVN